MFNSDDVVIVTFEERISKRTCSSTETKSKLFVLMTPAKLEVGIFTSTSDLNRKTRSSCVTCEMRLVGFQRHFRWWIDCKNTLCRSGHRIMWFFIAGKTTPFFSMTAVWHCRFCLNFKNRLLFILSNYNEIRFNNFSVVKCTILIFPLYKTFKCVDVIIVGFEKPISKMTVHTNTKNTSKLFCMLTAALEFETFLHFKFRCEAEDKVKFG